MQPLCDAVAVLGSRHGLVVDPTRREVGILRYDRFTRLPRLPLVAGVRLDGVLHTFPLCPEGTAFDLVDQRTSTCRVRYIGLEQRANLRVELDLVTPFRPRDADFSTIPAIGLRLRVEVMPGIFRWKPKQLHPESVELVLGVRGTEAIAVTGGDDAVDLRFDSVRAVVKEDFTDVWDTVDEARPQHDRLVAPGAAVRDGLLTATVDVSQGRVGELCGWWCTHDAPVLAVGDELLPFRYGERFADLEAVCQWARNHGGELFVNADRVEGIVHGHDLGGAVDKMLAFTLHSFLAGSWYARRADGREWFSVWEGTCYFHATVDVEFTQSPFYLAVWPELLGLQLDQWPDYALPGERCLGEAGRGTCYLSHDLGAHSRAEGQIYSHDMAVEEAANYLVLACAYHRRTGDDRLLRKHAGFLRGLVGFLCAADSTGNGVPDRGVANTIDDASPAVQFGTEQTYLAAKTLAALVAGGGILDHLDAAEDADLRAEAERRCGLLRAAIEERGWLGDHYAVLLEKSGRLTNPWSGEETVFAQIPGWDAAHIYTANALPPLDMVGLDVGLDADHLATDLEVATRRCLEEYGCSHSDFANQEMRLHETMLGLAGVARKPGWISMNLLRDCAAAYRGMDFRSLCQRYWDWQATTNSQEAKLFFETFKGNNLCFYPRGVAAWGLYDALARLVVDRVAGIDRSQPLAGVCVPRLLDADWQAGTCARLR